MLVYRQTNPNTRSTPVIFRSSPDTLWRGPRWWIFITLPVDPLKISSIELTLSLIICMFAIPFLIRFYFGSDPLLPLTRNCPKTELDQDVTPLLISADIFSICGAIRHKEIYLWIHEKSTFLLRTWSDFWWRKFSSIRNSRFIRLSKDWRKSRKTIRRTYQMGRRFLFNVFNYRNTVL